MRILTGALCCLLLIQNIQSQTTSSLNFQLSSPIGSYKNAYPKTGTGLLFSIVGRLNNCEVLSIGGEAGIIQVSNANKLYNGYYRGHFSRYNISATNYIFSIAPKLRINLYTFKNTAKIFADISAGTNVFFSYAAISHTKVTNEFLSFFLSGTALYDAIADNTQLKINSSFNHTSFAIRAGAGLGTEIPFGKKKQFAILVKFSYLFGSNTKYFSHPVINGLQINLEPQESETTMLLAETGIRFKIHQKK